MQDLNIIPTLHAYVDLSYSITLSTTYLQYKPDGFIEFDNLVHMNASDSRLPMGENIKCVRVYTFYSGCTMCYVQHVYISVQRLLRHSLL